jgi:hypothetical protein
MALIVENTEIREVRRTTSKHDRRKKKLTKEINVVYDPVSIHSYHESVLSSLVVCEYGSMFTV